MGNPKKIAMVEEELKVPPAPKSRAYLLGWFAELNRERVYSSMGEPLPISGRNFIDWSISYRRKPTVYDLSILRELDDVYLTVVRDSRSG